jgi:DNA-binding HxlR family transcriptional regulator
VRGLQRVQTLQLMIELVSGKWTLPVLAVLQTGPRRHNDLRRAVDPDLRPKVLDDALHRLNNHRLVMRQVELTGNPPAVWYSLTPAADMLMGKLMELQNWAAENRAALGLLPPGGSRDSR